MTGLPPALAAWGPELESLPEDLVLALEPWLVRLCAALGPLTHRPERGRGAPDGFDGLTRRGSYERLLATEWLLAEHLPEEFVRRAANTEHLFYALAEEQQSQHHRCLVLFDAGPEQIGAPRIVHLAVLLAMATRARRAGVDLFWGVLQDDKAELRRNVSTQSVMRLVRGRSSRNPSPDALDAWRRQLPEVAPSEEELWLVGGPRLVDLAPPSAGLGLVSEPVTLGTRTVQLELRRTRGPKRRTFEFDVPAGPLAVRLLRNPFEVVQGGARSTTTPKMLGTDLLFGADGRVVFTRAEDGVVAHALPTGSSEVPLPRLLPTDGEPTIAVGRIERSYHVVSVSEGRLVTRVFSRRGRLQYSVSTRAFADGAVPWADVPRRGLSPCLTIGGRRSEGLVILDGLGRALRVDRHRRALPIQLLSQGVTGIGRVGGRTVLVLDRLDDETASAGGAHEAIALEDARGRALRQGDLPRRAVVWLDPQGRVGRVVTLPAGDGDYAARFGASGVAVRFQPDEWFLLSDHDQLHIAVEPGPVLGPVFAAPHRPFADSAPLDGPLLMKMGDTGRDVELVGRGRPRVLGETKEPPTAPRLGPKDPLIAYFTPQDILRVEDLFTPRVVLTASPGAEP